MPERKDPDISSSKQPPPPCDPFTRYQTPWPRNETDEHNPFIQFRRFADEQFQSLFSGIPKLFGTSSSDADSFQHEIQNIIQQHREFNEGLKKRFEQDMEEQKQALAKLRGWADQQSQGQVISTPEPPKSPWWQKGEAAHCPALNEERSGRAKRCPAMFTTDGQPKTELDAYEAYEPHSILSRDATSQRLPDDLTKAIEEAREQRTPGPPAGWLTGLGWDGKRRHEKSTISVSRFSSRWLDPFNNSHDTIPWLLVNPYSPVALSNPDQPRAGQVKLQQGVNQPFRILGVYFLPRGFLQFNDRRDEMAKEFAMGRCFRGLSQLATDREDGGTSSFHLPDSSYLDSRHGTSRQPGSHMGL